MTPLTLSCTLWFGEFTVSQGSCFWSSSVCVRVHVCVSAICMSMSLTQSICCTSSGTNLSNLSYDCVVPRKFRMIHVCVCVSACSEQPHIILHYSDSAISLMSPHIWSCMHASFLVFKTLIICQAICNHFPHSSLGLTTVDQGHGTVTRERSHALPVLSRTAYACVCPC